MLSFRSDTQPNSPKIPCINRVNMCSSQGFQGIHIKIPNATHNCQPMTRLPRILAGEFSAANTGIVDALLPIPTPSRRRHTNSCGQFWVKAEPSTAAKQKKAETKIVPRRPTRKFKGCDSQQPLFINDSISLEQDAMNSSLTSLQTQSREPH